MSPNTHTLGQLVKSVEIRLAVAVLIEDIALVAHLDNLAADICNERYLAVDGGIAAIDLLQVIETLAIGRGSVTCRSYLMDVCRSRLWGRRDRVGVHTCLRRIR